QCTTQSPAIHESRAGRHFRYAGPPALQSRRQTDPTCPPAGYGMPDLESIAPESRKHHVEDQGISKCDSPARKGQQWYFGMKLHLGVDSKTKLIHSLATTAANVHDAKVLAALLHGDETRVYGDQAYRGQRAVIRERAPHAKDFTNRRYRHCGVVDEVERAKNRGKSGVRAKVEHSIGVIKRVFGFAKVRYRGLAKNTQRLWVTCGLANLSIVRHRLLGT